MTYLSFFLALPLLAHGNDDPDPLRALPADSVVVMSLPDLPGAIERTASNAWYRFFADPEVLSGLFAALSNELPTTEILTDGRWAQALALLAETDSIAVGCDPEFETVTIALRARGDGAQLAERVEALVGDDALWARSERLIVLDVSSRDGGLERTGAALGRAASKAGGIDPRELGLSRPHGIETPDLELIVRLGTLAEVHGDRLPDSAASYSAFLETVRNVHLVARAGSGEDVEMRVDLTYAPDSPWDEMFSSFEPLAKGSFDGLPQEAIAVTALQWDVARSLETSMALFSEHSPDILAALDEGIEEMESAIGVHPIDDVVRALSGGLMIYTLPLESELERLGDEEALSVLAFDGSTYVIGLADADTLVESVDRILAADGLDAQIERTVEGDNVLFELPTPVGTFACGFGPSRAVVSYDLTLVRQTLARIARDEPSRAWQDGPLAARLADSGGAWLCGVSSTQDTLLAMTSMLETLPQIVGEPTGDEADLFDLLYVLFEPARVTEHFAGTITTRATRMSGRLSLQTIGR